MEILKTAAAARYLGCSEWQVRRLAKSGKISFVRTGNGTSPFRFVKADLDSYVAAHRVPATGSGDSRLK